MISNIATEFHLTNPNNNILTLPSVTVVTRLIEPFSKNLVPVKPICIDESVNCLLEVINNTEKKPKDGFYV